MQRASAILSSVVCPALRYFPALSRKRHDFRRKKIYRTRNARFQFLYNVCLKCFFHSKKNWTRYQNFYFGLHVKYPLFLSDFNETWIFSTGFRKILVSFFIEIHPVGAEFHEDRHDIANSVFSQFFERSPSPKKAPGRSLVTFQKQRSFGNRESLGRKIVPRF